MSTRLLELIRRLVREELAQQRPSRLGVVTAVFPHESEDDEANYEANVRLKHEDLELRRVPMTVGCIGFAAPPRAGDLVLVHFVQGDLNLPLIIGRLYHADERVPLHLEDELLLEHRLPDGTLNHLRFAADGAIYLQRKVTAPEDNSEALTSIRIEGASGDVEIRTGDSLVLELTNDGNRINATCDSMNIVGDLNVDGAMLVTGDTAVEGDLVVGVGLKTTISGNEITGS
jgi:hypothetical protein